MKVLACRSKWNLIVPAILALASTLIVPCSARATYDPKHGRWLQRDPLGVRPDLDSTMAHGSARGVMSRPSPRRQYRSGMNLYQYVRGRPTGGRDPLGLDEFCPSPCEAPCECEVWKDEVFGSEVLWLGCMTRSECDTACEEKGGTNVTPPSATPLPITPVTTAEKIECFCRDRSKKCCTPAQCKADAQRLGPAYDACVKNLAKGTWGRGGWIGNALRWRNRGLACGDWCWGIKVCLDPE